MPMIEPLMLSIKLSSFKEKFFIFPLLFSWGHFHCPVFQVTDTFSYRLVCGFPLVYFSTQLYSSALWVLLELNIFSLLSFSYVCLFTISQVWWAFWWPWLWLLYQINCSHPSHSVFLGFCLVPSVETCSPAPSSCLAVCFSILCKPVMAPCLEGVVLCGRWTVLFNLFLVLGCSTKSLLVSLPWSPKMQSARHLPEPGTQGMSPVWAACDRWLWWCPTSGVGGGQRGYLLSVSASAAHKQCRAVGWGTLTHYCGQLRVSVQKWCPPVSSR